MDGGILLFLAAIWFAVTLYIAMHADHHGKSAPFWFVAVGLTGIIGLVFYAISLASD